jgi:hypothetical protein
VIERFFSADARNYRPSAIRALAKWIHDPKVISFAGGSPNDSVHRLTACARSGRAHNSRRPVERSVANGVAFVPGSPFFVDGSGRNTMRLTCAKEPDHRIREGVAKLAAVFA